MISQIGTQFICHDQQIFQNSFRYRKLNSKKLKTKKLFLDIFNTLNIHDKKTSVQFGRTCKAKIKHQLGLIVKFHL